MTEINPNGDTLANCVAYAFDVLATRPDNSGINILEDYRGLWRVSGILSGMCHPIIGVYPSSALSPAPARYFWPAESTLAEVLCLLAGASE